MPSPLLLDCYELRGVIGEGTAAIVYFATDRTLRAPVAIREYMPRRLAGRDAMSRVVPLSPVHEIPFAHGLQAFIEEARTLARCDHPALLRIVRLLETNGTAYSVMPHYVGRPLTDVGRDAKAAYDEDRLRALLDDLLGALETFHVFGRVHGGVAPDNVLLLQNGRPVLLRPRARSRERPGEPIDTLSGYLNVQDDANDASIDGATGPWTDVRDAARVIRFLMQSGGAGHDAASGKLGRSARDGGGAPSPGNPNARYSRSLLEALDAAESPLPERRPQSVGEFREWLKRTSPSQTAVPGAPRQGSAAPTEDVSVLVPQATWPTAARSERDALAESSDAEATASAKSDRDARTRRIALKTALMLVIVAVPAIAMWLIDQPPVAVQGWSKALVPPSLVPSRNAAKFDATAVATLPDAALEGPSPAVESGGGAAATALDATANAGPTVGDRADQAASIVSPSKPEAAATAPGNSGMLSETEVTAALSLPARQEAPRLSVSAAPVLRAEPKHGSPREACAPRTQFALYRCMQIQCSSPKWSRHAQCIRLRSSDDVN